MSGRRMKALRRAAFGDGATNAKSKVYNVDAESVASAVPVTGTTRVLKHPKVTRYKVPVYKVVDGVRTLTGHRHVTLRTGTVEIAGEGHRRYRDMKKEV